MELEKRVGVVEEEQGLWRRVDDDVEWGRETEAARLRRGDAKEVKNWGPV